MKTLKDIAFINHDPNKDGDVPLHYQMQIYGRFAKRYNLNPENELDSLLQELPNSEDCASHYWKSYYESERRIKENWHLPEAPENAIPAAFISKEGQVFLEWMDRATREATEGPLIAWPWIEGFIPNAADWMFLEFFVAHEAKLSIPSEPKAKKPKLRIIQGGLS